jgi:hypothetical protein
MTSAAQLLLDTWEVLLPQSPARRAVGLVAAMHTDMPGASLGGLSIGERDGALLTVRHKVFGPWVTAVSRCPQCDECVELTFDIDAARVADVAAATAEETLALEEDGWVVTARPPCCDDVISIEVASSDTEAEAELWRRCTLEARLDGEPRPADEVPDRVRALMEEMMIRADPQADVQLRLECPTCGVAWEQDLDIASFFWAEVDAWARRVLADVHLLARAYGWAEDEILALSPLRRRGYLELVGR